MPSRVSRYGGKREGAATAILAKVLKPTLVADCHPRLRGHLGKRYLEPHFQNAELPYQTRGTHNSKPQRIPRIIIDRPPAVVGGKATTPKIHVQSYANSWSRGTAFDYARSSRALGCQKVQHRLGRGIVELPAPRRETCQTG